MNQNFETPEAVEVDFDSSEIQKEGERSMKVKKVRIPRHHNQHDHTFNFWVGCQKLSEGCKNCYMYVLQTVRTIDPAKIRRCTTTWGKPVKWQEEAAKANKLASVFACNYSDFFLPEADEWRDDAWELIRQTPNLIWHLASKRTNLIAERLPKDWGNGYPNVWLGTSPEMKKYLPRMDALRDIPCVLRWIDCAPILEDLTPDLGDHLEGFDWVCVGREEGSGKIEPRPSDEQWVRNIRDLCAQRGIAFMYTCGGGKHPITDPLLDGKQHLAVPPLRWGFDRLGLPLPKKVVTTAVKSSKKENAA
jgi:protein gp37